MRTLRLSIFPDHKCSEHGIVDSQPCPWPLCQNGLTDDQFQVEPILEGDTPTVYTRKEWHSLTGDPYYSWEESKLPNWFYVEKVIWNEARRKGVIAEEVPKLIYHYTSVDGFFGIVQHRNLWLSDYSYLNDTRELSHGADLICEVAEELRKNELRPLAASLLETWIKDIKTVNLRVCIASFSASADSLSQWRAYGPIAIGFKPRDVSIHTYRANLRPVEYCREKQRAMVEICLHHMREAFLLDADANRLEKIKDVYHKTDKLIELVSFFKDPAFESEQEYRLVYIEYPGLTKLLGGKRAEKRFRISRGNILPYVLSNELEPILPNQKPLEIREVMLGPETNEMLERGIREFLAENGMDNVIIKRSIIPYRT